MASDERALLQQALACSVVGPPETVARELPAFAARHQADELMITCQLFDHAQRLHSLSLTRQAVA